MHKFNNLEFLIIFYINLQYFLYGISFIMVGYAIFYDLATIILLV